MDKNIVLAVIFGAAAVVGALQDWSFRFHRVLREPRS